MKRYLVFMGQTYYPGGGWDDFVASVDTVIEANRLWATKDCVDWYQVVDTVTMKEVEKGDNGIYHAR